MSYQCGWREHTAEALSAQHTQDDIYLQPSNRNRKFPDEMRSYFVLHSTLFPANTHSGQCKWRQQYRGH